MEDIGLEFNSVWSPSRDLTLRSRSQTYTFHIKSKCLHLSFYSYIITTFWWISLIFGMMVEIVWKFYSREIPVPGRDLQIKVTDTSIFILKSNFLIKVYIAICISYHTKFVEGYIVFAFLFVCMYVRSFIRWSFRRHVRGTRVKVFVPKFIRPYIIKTLWWISFLFGMMVDLGLKFYWLPYPP